MNALIVGGLFAVALAALIAVFFVARSDPAPQTSNPAALVDEEKPTSSNVRAALQQPSLSTSASPVEETILDTEETAEQHPILNGQLYELSLEVRTLHKEAQDLERRLHRLVEMVERIENSQQEYQPVPPSL